MSWKFSQWCHRATSLIRCKPDREEVYQELRQHMDDRYAAYLQTGAAEDDAVVQTLQDMGNADVLAPQLAAVHRPFWSYALVTARVIVVCLLILLSVPLWRYIDELSISRFPNTGDYYTMTQLDSDYRRIFYCEPGTSAELDGYRFTVTQVAVWKVVQTDREPIYYHCFRIQVRKPLLWSRMSHAVEWFWGEDDLGNLYYSQAECPGPESTSIAGSCITTGLQTCTYDLFLQGRMPANIGQITYLDLHYDRDGRQLVLRIPFAGGEGT